MRPPRSMLLALSLSVATRIPAPAQTSGASADSALEIRNRAFLEAVVRGSRAGVLPFVPTRGEWTWVQTITGDGASRAETHRFAAAQTRDAIGIDGPACQSFRRFNVHEGPLETVLSMYARLSGTTWKRVGTRFVPPAGTGASPWFVEWRREDDRWVISAFGDVLPAFARKPGPPQRQLAALRDTTSPLLDTPVYATGTDWLSPTAVVTFEGKRYGRYSGAREVDATQLARVGRVGNVPVFAYRNNTREPGILFVPVSARVFQPYDRAVPSGCR